MKIVKITVQASAIVKEPSPPKFSTPCGESSRGDQLEIEPKVPDGFIHPRPPHQPNPARATARGSYSPRCTDSPAAGRPPCLRRVTPHDPALRD